MRRNEATKLRSKTKCYKTSIEGTTLLIGVCTLYEDDHCDWCVGAREINHEIVGAGACLAIEAYQVARSRRVNVGFREAIICDVVTKQRSYEA